MRFRMRTCLAVMGAVAMLGAFGADSATSQPGVLDSRLRAHGRAAARNAAAETNTSGPASASTANVRKRDFHATHVPVARSESG